MPVQFRYQSVYRISEEIRLQLVILKMFLITVIPYNAGCNKLIAPCIHYTQKKKYFIFAIDLIV